MRPDVSLRRWLQLPRDQRCFLLQMLLLLPALSVSLRVLGSRRTARALGELGGRKVHDSGISPQRAAALLDIAARHGLVSGTCLTRSLALRWGLHRHGIDCQLRIGVCKDSEGRLAAHAWVEHGSKPVNDGADVAQRYAAFEGDVLPSGVRWS